jgi:hypothetical protein
MIIPCWNLLLVTHPTRVIFVNLRILANLVYGVKSLRSELSGSLPDWSETEGNYFVRKSPEGRRGYSSKPFEDTLISFRRLCLLCLFAALNIFLIHEWGTVIDWLIDFMCLVE